MPRPAHPPRRQDRGVQAALASPAPTGRATRPQAAPAPLRHRLLRQEGPRRLPRAARGGQEARPPHARQGARACSRSRRWSGTGLILWMPKGAIVRGILENFIEERADQARLPAGLHPAHRQARAVPHQRPLSLLPGRAVPAAEDARRRRGQGAARRPDRRARSTTTPSARCWRKAGIPERLPRDPDRRRAAAKSPGIDQAATSR